MSFLISLWSFFSVFEIIWAIFQMNVVILHLFLFVVCLSGISSVITLQPFVVISCLFIVSHISFNGNFYLFC